VKWADAAAVAIQRHGSFAYLENKKSELESNRKRKREEEEKWKE
jgi:hypothetical protein